MLGGAASAGGGGDDLLTVTVVRDEHGYGMKVSGDNPVYVQSVKEHGAAWRAGLRSGDRILRVDNVPVEHHSHQQVVHMIRATPTTVLTVQQNTSRLKTPITAPVPANLEKQRQFEASKVKTIRLMLDQEQKYIRDLRNELLKVPDVRKQTELESAEQRCSTLQHQIDGIMAGQPVEIRQLPSTPRNARTKTAIEKPASSPLGNTGFLSGLPRSLSNLTGQSLRNLRQARQKNSENQPPLVRQNSDESSAKRRHNNTVPMVPTTCLDNVSPPPLPPRSIERPKRNPLSPTSPINPPLVLNPLAQGFSSPSRYYHKRLPDKPGAMHHSMPGCKEERQLRRSSHSLDGELDGPQPNSIALQMSYPLVNVPPPPLLTDNHSGVPVLHMRSRSSPDQLDHELCKSATAATSGPGPGPGPGLGAGGGEWGARDTPPPGTPPPPYHTNTQPCADPQRAIISMEEDDSPASESSTYSGLFSNLRAVRDSKARTAVLLNWLLAERRCACACLLLVLTDAYRSATGVTVGTLRRWAYEIHSAFLMPHAVLQLNGVDENMANEIEHVLVNEYDKEELLRNVFRKARQKAKEELTQQLSEFQVKRQVGLGTLYGPEDDVILKCHVDKIQEQLVVERVMSELLRNMSGGGGGAPCGGAGGAPCGGAGGASGDAGGTLLAALTAAATALHCRAASVAAALGGQRASFLQRDKLYKQRVKQITKQHPQPLVVRGHHLQLLALTSVGHCHRCDHVIWGLAPQAYVCTDCKLRVHRACARAIEEGCCLDGEHHNNRISRFMERIHNNNLTAQDSTDKKSRKPSGTAHFLNMERSFRKAEDEGWDQTLKPESAIGESKREGSNEEPTAADTDVDASDAATKEPDKDSTWRVPSSGRGVNRAESCRDRERERELPRRGKHRNASDPNRLTAHNNHDLEPGAPTAPSGSSSSSSLSSRSTESNTVPAEQHASQSEWSEEEEPLAAQWADTITPRLLEGLALSSRLRKRQELIHELIVSEGSHVRWLKVLSTVFLRALEGQPSLLPPEDLRALFPNLPSVKERHLKLYAELRALRTDVDAPLVHIRGVADAMLNALGDSGYGPCLAKFCSGQRMALEVLRERRRKNKELHSFLASREQLPLCGRLQLRDLLACVWQRLTKYQLLLEGVVKTVSEADGESEEDVAKLGRALAVAKDVLHSVDTAIRTAENEHRLRSIHSKLEIRAPSGADWEELRRFDLTPHSLRYDGDLTIKNDANKKIHVLGLMLEEYLVLVHREGDRFVLKPISQTSQHHLSPLIKWDKVLFRPNAAVRNTFFLMNINRVQMHELSANTAPEYATWVKHIQDAPLAKVTDLKSSITPSHQATRSADDSGINVSRNPSDASEKSEKSHSTLEDESERDRTSAERSSAERERDSNIEREDKERSVDKEQVREEKEEIEKEEKHKPRRPTEGRIVTHSLEPAPALEPCGALRVAPPAALHAATAERAYTRQERLRRLDEIISRSLRAKSAIVAEMLHVPAAYHRQLADLAVADALGQFDVTQELRNAHMLSRSNSAEEEESTEPDMQQLLLAACTQANQLTSLVRQHLSVDEAGAVAARARCDACARGKYKHAESLTPEPAGADADLSGLLDSSYDGPDDVSRDSDALDVDDVLEGGASAALLARQVVAASVGIQHTLTRLLAAAPPPAHALREELATLRERNDALLARTSDHQLTEEISFSTGAISTMQDQPSNGG